AGHHLKPLIAIEDGGEKFILCPGCFLPLLRHFTRLQVFAMCHGLSWVKSFIAGHVLFLLCRVNAFGLENRLKRRGNQAEAQSYGFVEHFSSHSASKWYLVLFSQFVLR
ncbi:hypothetical protein AVEN_47140-1, partial [Araneus ventricosus]